MLAEFEWLFRSTFEWALEDHAASGATIARKEFQEVLAAGGWKPVCQNTGCECVNRAGGLRALRTCTWIDAARWALTEEQEASATGCDG